MKNQTEKILQMIKSGEMSVEDALLQLKKQPFEDLGYAHVDYHRAVRQGTKEVIFGQGKSAEQIVGIATNMVANGLNDILVTRLAEDVFNDVHAKIADAVYYPLARAAIIAPSDNRPAVGNIVLVSAGTSDIGVCEEAALTALSCCLPTKLPPTLTRTLSIVPKLAPVTMPNVDIYAGDVVDRRVLSALLMLPLRVLGISMLEL